MNDKSLIGIDMLRGFSAILVLISHVRNFLFIDFKDLTNPNYFSYFFYFITSLGHSAVILFFMLSGFLVGGGVFNRFKLKSFNLREYLFNRFSRLYVVLIPALFIGLFFDFFGKALTGNKGYDGSYHYFLGMGPGFGVDYLNISIVNLFCNVFFLQTVLCPVYGSNGPLWSLANEAWYYLTFPIIIYILFRKTIFAAMLIFLILYLYSNIIIGMLEGGVVFIMGFLAYLISNKFNINFKPYHWISIVILLLLGMIGCKYIKGSLGDFFLAFCIMLILILIPRFQIENKRTKWIIINLSKISFSLYLFHFPFLTFLYFVFMAPAQFEPNFESFILFVIICIVSVFYSFSLYYFFEKNTESFKFFIRNFFSRFL